MPTVQTQANKIQLYLSIIDYPEIPFSSFRHRILLIYSVDVFLLVKVTKAERTARLGLMMLYLERRAGGERTPASLPLLSLLEQHLRNISVSR